MSNPKHSILSDKDDQFKVYLPKKGADGWKDTNNLEPKDYLTSYPDSYKGMEILNNSTFKDCLDNDEDQFGKYVPTDEHSRHPVTLYLTPGSPYHRSNSLAR